MQGKRALVTGTTNGVGRALVRWLAERDWEVIATGRNQQKLDAVVDDVRSATGNPRVHGFVCDQLHLRQVDKLANDLHFVPTLDLLFNNAAVCPDTRMLSPEGYEAAFTVNHLAHFLLTLRMLPKLGAGAHIVHVSSSAMGGGQLRFDDLHGEREFDGWQAYSNSKLAQVLFSNTLSERLADRQIRSNAVCPGMVDSGLIVNHRMFRDRMDAMRHMLRPAEEAAAFVGWLATTPEHDRLSGAFFSKGYHGKTPVRMQAPPALQQQLWDCSEDLVRPFLRDG